jgi:hypothetical protein
MPAPKAEPNKAQSRVGNARQALLSSIKKQFITIPDMKPVLEDWRGMRSAMLANG